MKVEPGQLIGGKYELERLLGKGAMGEVWLARHATLDDSYAVKLIDVNAVPDAGARFKREAHIAAKLSKRTRHIVSVTDHGEQGELAYLVMQLLEGESLADRITSAAPLPLSEVSAIVTQVARALTHAHDEGFVHRDMKPANVFLTKDEDGRVVVKLLDFGIARVVRGERSPFTTAKDTIIGTPSYMSPEQARALDELDHRCDLWALAVVAYEAMTGAHPFEGESLQDVLISIGIGRQVPIRERRPDLPDAIGDFFDTAFADEIEQRFSSAQQLARALARACGVGGSDRPSMAPPRSMPPAPPREPSLTPSMMPGPWLGADGMPSRMPRPPRLPSEGADEREDARRAARDRGDRGNGEGGDAGGEEEARGLPRRAARSPWVWGSLIVMTAGIAAGAMGVTRASRPQPGFGLAASATATAPASATATATATATAADPEGAGVEEEAAVHGGASAEAGAGEGATPEGDGAAALENGGYAGRPAATRAALDAGRAAAGAGDAGAGGSNSAPVGSGASTANATPRPPGSPGAGSPAHVPAPARSVDRGAVF